MQLSPLDSFESAIAAYAADKRDGFVRRTFSNAVVDIKTFDLIDEIAAAAAIASAAKLCRRLYALIKYGSQSRRLSKAESKESQPTITRLGGKHIRFDFNPPLQRMWAIADSKNTSEKSLPIEPLFGLLREKITPLSEVNSLRALKHLINAAALVVAVWAVAPVASQFGLEWQKEADRQQTSLLQLPKMQIGGVSSASQKIAEQKIADRTERQILDATTALIELKKDDPVLTFVSEQIEQVQPPLFRIVSMSGGGKINGVEFSPDGAARIAKRTKQKTQIGTKSWSATVIVTS